MKFIARLRVLMYFGDVRECKHLQNSINIVSTVYYSQKTIYFKFAQVNFISLTNRYFDFKMIDVNRRRNTWWNDHRLFSPSFKHESRRNIAFYDNKRKLIRNRFPMKVTNHYKALKRRDRAGEAAIVLAYSSLVSHLCRLTILKSLFVFLTSEGGNSQRMGWKGRRREQEGAMAKGKEKTSRAEGTLKVEVFTIVYSTYTELWRQQRKDLRVISRMQLVNGHEGRRRFRIL